MNNRDILEDQFIKETGRFAFLDPNKLNPEYVEWLEKELIKGQTLPIDSVSQQSEFKSSTNIEVNLVGDIKLSSESNRTTKEAENFLIELESVMTKYKVVSINACFDVFKMKRALANER